MLLQQASVEQIVASRYKILEKQAHVDGSMAVIDLADRSG